MILEYARKNINFWQNTPIRGQFDERQYPFIAAPLESFDNPVVKQSVIYGPTQSVKTVVLEIVAAYLLDIRRKSVIAVAQTNEDAGEFSKVKLNPFLERIPSLTSTLRKGKHNQTLFNWIWATHELIISGPGLNEQNSKSACYVLTDEAHLWNVQYPGALEALNDRTGLRWDRRIGHFTTAADAGTDIDKLYHKGAQNEWNMRCPACGKHFEPLWEDASKEKYNGHRVFRFTEHQSISATLASLRAICPHCEHGEYRDTPADRRALDDGATYVPGNPDHDRQIDSYRWNAFAPRWKPWADLLATYFSAIEDVKLGKLDTYENWIKKQEVRTWTGDFPSLASGSGKSAYLRSDVADTRDGSIRICSIDVQEGRNGEGFHLWIQADEYDSNGSSRRLDYQRLATWTDARQFQQDHRCADKHTGADFGHRAREVFGVCAEYHWTALKSTDEEEFHVRTHRDSRTGEVTIVRMPYSEHRVENPLAGKDAPRIVFRGRQIPRGMCVSRLWSKPSIYPILFALKSGFTGREYGIPADMPKEYEEQLHSYVQVNEVQKKTNLIKLFWRKTRTDDHAHVTSAQALVIAIAAGYYPLANHRQITNDQCL